MLRNFGWFYPGEPRRLKRPLLPPSTPWRGSNFVLRWPMTERQPPHNLEELVDRLEEAAEQGEKVSLDLMMDEVGRRSFGPLLLLGGLLMAAPVIGDIPVVPVILGLFVLLVAAQLLRGRDHFWLPQWLLRRSVSSEKMKHTTHKWLRRPARFIDRFLKRRWDWLTRAGGARAIAVASILLGLSTPVAEFIPFSANGVGAAIALFGLALIAHDGVVALIGWLVVGLTVGLATWSAM
jgi:hypothetical protein